MAENVAESLTKGTRIVVTGRLQQRQWEDNDGNKRSAFEIQVDEVGPSLRWATATIQKSQRSGGQSSGGGGGGGGQQSGGGQSGGSSDWSAPAPVGSPADEGGF
jgi:single-strand DNA-binding protein